MAEPPTGYRYSHSEFHPSEPASKWGWHVDIYVNPWGEKWARRRRAWRRR